MIIVPLSVEEAEIFGIACALDCEPCKTLVLLMVVVLARQTRLKHGYIKGTKPQIAC